MRGESAADRIMRFIIEKGFRVRLKPFQGDLQPSRERRSVESTWNTTNKPIRLANLHQPLV